MSCNCCGEYNKLFYCSENDCDICIECIESGNLESYSCNMCDEKDNCEVYKYNVEANESKEE